MAETISDHIERIFRELDDLIKTGQFTRDELNFMESFLTIALNGTKKVIARAETRASHKM